MALPKLCFVVPEYNSQTASHFNYLYDFVRNISRDFDIFLVLEKARDYPDVGKEIKIYIQKFRFFPLRVIENFLVFCYARLAGCRDFYVHYSFISAFNSSLIARLSGGRTFYWNCGLPWLYKRNFLRNSFERIVYKSVTFLVTGTEGLKNEYSNHYSLPLSKIKVLPNWINLNNFKINHAVSEKIRKDIDPSGKNKILLFVHRLSRRKGAQYLPEIISGLKNENVILAVIGDGPERQSVEAEIEKRGLSGRTRFLGNVPNRDIADYFGAADVFIMPSEEEGFPHVLLEAMASGILFVSFLIGGIKDIIPAECRKFTVTFGDKNSFTNKVREILYYNRAEIWQLSDIEKNWVKKFNLSAVIEEFKKLLYHNFHGK